MEVSTPQFQKLKQSQSDHIVKSHSDDKREYIPEPYKKVARDLETQFTEFMLEQMKKTEGGKEKSTAENYYESLLNKERAERITSQNAGGQNNLQQMILDQIYPEHRRTKEAFQHYQNQLPQQSQFITRKPSDQGSAIIKANEI